MKSDHQFQKHLLSIAGGTWRETVQLLDALDADDRKRAATSALSEVVSRTQLFDGPPVPVTVQFDIETAGERLGYLVTVGPRPATAVPGWTDHPHVVIRQELAELLRAVYGLPGPRNDATREVFIVNEPGPETDAPDDPWLAKRHAATLAAGQAVSACSRYQTDLGALARRFGSDKWGGHFYTPNYERHFAPYRDQRVVVLEIGVGGFQSPDSGGESLRMWKYFFPRGMIYGLDLFDKSGIDEPRIRTIRGDQSDPTLLAEIVETIGAPDIIIDDGSHLSRDVIVSFNTLFPLLPPGATYVIEDLQTSYWPGWNGHSTDLNDPATSVGFLKTLLDGLHHQDRMCGGSRQSSAIERTVASVHVYHNLVFIEKGVNGEMPAPSWVQRNLSDMDLAPKGSMRRRSPTSTDPAVAGGRSDCSEGVFQD